MPHRVHGGSTSNFAYRLAIQIRIQPGRCTLYKFLCLTNTVHLVHSLTFALGMATTKRLMGDIYMYSSVSWVVVADAIQPSIDISTPLSTLLKCGQVAAQVGNFRATRKAPTRPSSTGGHGFLGHYFPGISLWKLVTRIQ